MKIKKYENIIFITVFFAIITAVGISIFILPTKSFSEAENRNLKQFPKIRRESVLNGEFFDDLGEFYRDQLPLRRELGYLYSMTELALGKHESNGIIYTLGGKLIARPEGVNENIYNANMQDISKLCASNKKFTVFIPPSTVQVFSESFHCALQKNKFYPSLGELGDGFLDEILSVSNKDRYYYTTDHHWTSDGAYLAYLRICKYFGIEPYAEDHFTVQNISDSFYGSSYRISALPKQLCHPDNIAIYRYDDDSLFTLTDADGNVIMNGFYDFGAKDKSDKYLIFLGGNYPYLSVKMQSKKARPKLLLIKDSFANSVVPFLALHYDIEMIDPRYADPSMIDTLMNDGKFDRILLLCSAQTMATEKKIGLFADKLCLH